MNELATIISTVGFPIVSFLISAYFIKYTYDKQNERDIENDKRNDIHWNKLSELTSAVNENSTALRELITVVKGEKE